MKIIEKGNELISKFVADVSGLSQAESRRNSVEKTITKGMPQLLRRAAAQGAVLLKNDGVLPFSRGECISLFGRVQRDWFYTGYGSGGDVNNPYAVNLVDGIRNCDKLKLNTYLADIYEKWCSENPINHGYWGHWPRFYPEMPLTSQFVKASSSVANSAVIAIGRSSGEDRENALEQGSFYLTDDERNMINLVTSFYDKTVVLLNIGSIMDMSWIEEYKDKIGAVMIVWQGGMESGNAIADLLCGEVSPCGKLSDTIAKSYSAYPSSNDFGGGKFNNYTEDIYVGYRWFETFKKEDVLYPFGFGLSYSSFDIKYDGTDNTQDGFSVSATVTNTGSHTAKEAVQLYVEKPCGVLGNPSRELAAFKKTRSLKPGESQSIKLEVAFEQLASYDDSGETGFAYSYVIEQGEYKLYLGTDVRSAEKIFSYYQENTELFEERIQVAAPEKEFEIYCAVDDGGVKTLSSKTVSLSKVNLKQRILDNMPHGTKMTGDKGYKLSDVKSGRITMEEFVAQLDLTELEAISRGDYVMNSPLGVSGNAGAFAGVLESLRAKGIPAVTTTDGPSGIRLDSCCSLIPIGTLLACTFDEELVKQVYSAVGREMVDKGTDVLLAPGMNIHRNPLCGRNFEYYSEDPFLTGSIAVAAVSGIQSAGVSACPKHFACNNQEFKRNTNDSRLSERALRQIYLKGFEICIKKAKPKNIMTSYNKINGVWCHYQYDLCTTVLRGEWGYNGNVMTDWWMKSSSSPEFPSMRNQAYRVRSQVDVLMPGGDRTGKRKPDKTLLETYSDEDGITLGELQRTAQNVLNFAMNSTAMEREIK